MCGSPIAGPGGRKRGPQYALIICPPKEIFFGGTRGGGKADARSASNQHLASFKRQKWTSMAARSETGLRRQIVRRDAHQHADAPHALALRVYRAAKAARVERGQQHRD